MTVSAWRAKCLAGGCPLERPVRQHGSLGRQRPKQNTSAFPETCRPSRLFAPRRWQVEGEEQAKAEDLNSEPDSKPCLRGPWPRSDAGVLLALPAGA